MKVEEFEFVREILEGMPKNTQRGYIVTLRLFMDFVNSKTDLIQTITPDDLVREGKENVQVAEKRIDDFYVWLQGGEVKGYRNREKAIKSSSAFQRAYGYLRGFYVNHDVGFEKKWTKRIPQPSKKESLKKDNLYTFFKVDEDKKEIYFDRELLRQFLANLKLRDIAITLALLSSSQDSGDLFKLNVGDIREQSGRNRIFLEGTRAKTKIMFRTFLSKEATKFIKKYIDQERRHADDEEPLFVTSGNSGNNRMTSSHLSSVYRDTARKMGIQWNEGERNPLRPKRMRSLFRTACDTTGIPELFTNAFMGHKNSQGQDYSEVDLSKLELEYIRVEPFLTVYGEAEESVEVKEEMSKLQTTIETLTKNLVGTEKELREKTQLIEALAENDRSKGDRLADIEKQLESMRTQLKMLDLVFPFMLQNIMVRLSPEEKEKLSELYETVVKNSKEG